MRQSFSVYLSLSLCLPHSAALYELSCATHIAVCSLFLLLFLSSSCVQFCLFLISFVRHLTVCLLFLHVDCLLPACFSPCLPLSLSISLSPLLYLPSSFTSSFSLPPSPPLPYRVSLWHIFHTPFATVSKSCLTDAHFITRQPLTSFPSPPPSLSPPPLSCFRFQFLWQVKFL